MTHSLILSQLSVFALDYPIVRYFIITKGLQALRTIEEDVFNRFRVNFFHENEHASFVGP